MKANFDEEEDQDEVKKEFIMPKYKLIYSDLEVDLKETEPQEDREVEEEKKEEEAKLEGEEVEEKQKELTPVEIIVKNIATIMEHSTEAKPITDKELAMKLKAALDMEPKLVRPAYSSDEIEECGVWQVIVGKQFAASVSFDARHVFYFQMEESRKYFLVFRS